MTTQDTQKITSGQVKIIWTFIAGTFTVTSSICGVYYGIKSEFASLRSEMKLHTTEAEYKYAVVLENKADIHQLKKDVLILKSLNQAAILKREDEEEEDKLN